MGVAAAAEVAAAAAQLPSSHCSNLAESVAAAPAEAADLAAAAVGAAHRSPSSGEFALLLQGCHSREGCFEVRPGRCSGCGGDFEGSRLRRLRSHLEKDQEDEG